MPPAARTASAAASASLRRPELHGVMVEWPSATPMIGLEKSPSPKPTARSIARFGARSSPVVTTALLRLVLASDMCDGLLVPYGSDHGVGELRCGARAAE